MRSRTYALTSEMFMTIQNVLPTVLCLCVMSTVDVSAQSGEVEEHNALRRTLLSTYRVGELSGEQFESDSWSVTDPLLQKLGIVEVWKIENVDHYRIGTYTQFPVGTFAHNESFVPITESYQYFRESILRNDRNRQWTNATGSRVLAAVLEFRDGILQSISVGPPAPAVSAPVPPDRYTEHMIAITSDRTYDERIVSHSRGRDSEPSPR